MIEKRAKRRTLFAVIGVVAGLVLLFLEVARPPEGTTTEERWFWFVIGALLVGLGVAELMSPGKQKD